MHIQKKTFVVFVLLLAALGASACGRDRVVYVNQQPNAQPVVQAANGVQINGQVNLNPDAVLNLAMSSVSATDFEQKLNTSGIANIDSDGDGQVDPLQVRESAPGGVRTFTIMAIGSTSGQETFVANVPFQQYGNGQVQVAFSGNPLFYSQPHYSVIVPIGGIPIWNRYFIVAHPLYAPTWGYRTPPAYYHSAPVRTVQQVTTVTRTVTKVPVTKEAAPAIKVTTPNDNKVASTVSQKPQASAMGGRSMLEKNNDQTIRVGANSPGAPKATGAQTAPAAPAAARPVAPSAPVSRPAAPAPAPKPAAPAARPASVGRKR